MSASSSSSVDEVYHRADLWSDAEWAFLQRLSETPVVPTRFACRKVLFEMGIRDSLDEFSEKLNFKSLSSMEYNTYPSLTRQFLASTSYLVKDSSAGWGRISFKIGQSHYSLSYAKFLAVYGIIDDIYGTTLISKVRNPIVRYALRLLSKFMFVRLQSCLAKEEELRMVYGATQKWLNNRYGKPLNRPWMRPKVGSWLLNQIFKAKHDAVANPDYQICIGGLPTPIFAACGIDLNLHWYFQHISKMDFDYLVTTHTLAGRLYPNTLVYRYMEDEDTPLSCFLPQLKYSTADCVRNLQFSLPRDQVIILPPPQNIVPQYN
ncbi:unnamed protein product [Arabis nemorensis]|uniref:Arabidopsis retrotransposon Orf1 C-terminal domain-containing protein n=1 Tax=Arabis nemorensis TaxID=586526 RepID=A0A565AY42_9BRAS|nr:unnamed protein product [Arabis nemorensis]